MSQENVEIVRRVYEAAARRDASAVLALYDPEIELDASRLGVPGLAADADGISRGYEGLKHFFREWHQAWGSIEYDFEELIDAGEQVISVVNRRGRGRASGVDVELHVALVWTLRDDRVVRVVWFPSRERALEAAGLSE